MNVFTWSQEIKFLGVIFFPAVQCGITQFGAAKTPNHLFVFSLSQYPHFALQFPGLCGQNHANPTFLCWNGAQLFSLLFQQHRESFQVVKKFTKRWKPKVEGQDLHRQLNFSAEVLNIPKHKSSARGCSVVQKKGWKGKNGDGKREEDD